MDDEDVRDTGLEAVDADRTGGAGTTGAGGGRRGASYSVFTLTSIPVLGVRGPRESWVEVEGGGGGRISRRFAGGGAGAGMGAGVGGGGGAVVSDGGKGGGGSLGGGGTND